MSKSTFWSDSANVLWWVRGRSRHFRSFVSNRVGEIQSHTTPDQWRHIPTKLNLADFLSRGIKATELGRRGTWWRGPDFLGEPEETWPINKNLEKLTTDVEMKRSTLIPRDQNSEAENNRSFSFKRASAVFFSFFLSSIFHINIAEQEICYFSKWQI